MLWVAAENWPWLLLSAALGAATTSALVLRRVPPVRPANRLVLRDDDR